MKRAFEIRLVRVVGLALVVWPFVLGSGREADQTKTTSWHVPEVGRCQAASLPGGTTLGGILTYDANGIHCVVGGDGCDLHYK